MDESLIVCDNLVKIYKVANLEVVALQGLDLVGQARRVAGHRGGQRQRQVHPDEYPRRARSPLRRAGLGGSA